VRPSNDAGGHGHPVSLPQPTKLNHDIRVHPRQMR
jgi:hypothetical protein